jgi:7-cyano-7-deazaguanine synthase
MCSIVGAIGDDINFKSFHRLWKQAGDRGRNGGRFETYSLRSGQTAVLGNWRATPTPEVEKAPLQPYDGVVHNGTIANDKELGGRPGEVDSMVLPRILNRTSLEGFVESLKQIKGSYALAAKTDDGILLACNYKPLYYWQDFYNTIYFSSMERHFEGVVSEWERPKKLTPYSALELPTGKWLLLPRKQTLKTVVIASSGLDSTVVATKLKRTGCDVHLLHFNYGCKAETKEQAAIVRIAASLGCKYSIINLNLKQLGAHSSITDGDDVSIGGAVEGSEYAIDWVPARNLMMLSLATAFAESNGYHAIALGNNLEESGAYPDNEEEFTHLFEGLLPYATQNGYKIDVLSPVGHLMKHEIVRLGLDLGAPFEHTWSCYRSGDRHCGRCGPCFMRQEAFRRCGVEDPVFLK